MDLIIQNSSEKPIYEQIVDQIKNHIIDGSLEAGILLPSIRGLAKDLRISVITTKRAYDELEREGYIETITGKGSYVSNINKSLLKEEFLKKMEQHLYQAIYYAKCGTVSINELKELIDDFYKEEKNE